MALERTTNRTVRLRNRAVLLSKLFLEGPLTRQDLARDTGLSQPAVSNVVADLVAAGLVVDAGALESDGGRPSMSLRVAPRFALVAGVDVGETRVRVELFDLSMALLASADHPIDAARPDPATVVRHIVAGLAAVTEEAGVSRSDLLGVGVGVSGVVVQGGEAVVYAQTLGWDGVPLERMIRAEVDVPLYIDNGAKTQGQAEMWFGAGRRARHAVFALVGSGVGATVVSGGTTYRGVASSAGEWGHTTLVYGGRACRCGARGCLEAYVGAEGIIERYREARRGRAVPGADEESQINALLAAADRSETARRVLDETAAYLGAGVANLINLFNPERVVLGGWAGLALGARLLPAIRDAAAAQALRKPFEQASVELGQLGVDAVALGAATLPVAHLLAAGGVRADNVAAAAAV
ncbi:ROK family transcriptional regulator [Phytohabitans sp. ZYX-F-186]|uniref:ROK family transcriptional regulator n=1 Tax=Phytohabitans maris TaxID=3071409 RepID=A0ABU0ZQP6_9ACTN|nr:ROK family transcriptional regulator [Phytohabitans sp. ZYX-F-186]MDQ7908664.1 ROK family transcriptional regulator [Phytohabitans sp. ZYX-F-186]